MSPVLPELLAFAAASTLLALVPGPDTLVMLRSIVLDGRRTATLTAVGILTGLAVWICAAALGLTALLRASHDGYTVLRIVGAAYLLFIGAQALRHRASAGGPLGRSPADASGSADRGRPRPAGRDPDSTRPRLGSGAVPPIPPTPRARVIGRGFRAGLLTDLLNPKVGVFFITFLPAFIPRGEPVMPATFSLGAVFLAVSIVYYAVMLVLVERITRWLRSDRFQRRLNRVTGIVLIGFGIRLAVEG